MSKRRPKDFRVLAVRWVTETRPEHHTKWSAIRQMEKRFGVGPETVRKQVRKAEIDAENHPGVNESEKAERDSAPATAIHGNA
jgi:hypothetical protein